MAKLSQLTEGFMQAFLRNNPKSLVDSNGYLRSEYEEELARRAQPVTEQPTGVPDPRTWRPQFECTGEVAPPAFESPDTQLGVADIKQLGEEGYLTQEQMEAILTAPLVLTTTPAPPLAEGQPRLRIVDTPLGAPDTSAQCDQQTEARNDEAPVIEDCAVRPVETPDPILTDAEAQAESAYGELHLEPSGSEQ